MLDLRLTYDRRAGVFRPGSSLDLRLAADKFSDGEQVRAKLSKRRSCRQNRYFHALVAAAYENQRGGPVLPSADHLRAWLLIQVGHCEEVRVPLGDMPERDVVRVVAPIAAALRQRFETVETTYSRSRSEIVMRFAKSVQFDKAEAERMNVIVDRVTAMICTVICPGLDPQAIFDHAKAAA